MLVRHPQAAGGRARPHPTGLASHASLPQPPRRRPQRSLPRPPRPPPGAAPRPTCWGSYLDQARIAQRTSFLAVASCGLLPRTTRPGPRLRTAFWSVTSPHPRDMNGRPGPSAVRGFVVDFERFEPSHGVECHRAVSSWAKRACERSRRIRTSSPRALGSRILRRLRMTLSLCRTRTDGTLYSGGAEIEHPANGVFAEGAAVGVLDGVVEVVER